MALPAAQHQRRVLLVEDDAAMAQMYKLKLELDGHRVEVARDGDKGLVMARQLDPDIIFLDIALPLMNGLALLDQLRADARLRDVPVLILTNHDEPDNQTRATQLGARDFLSKSKTTPDDLSRLVRRVTGSARS